MKNLIISLLLLPSFGFSQSAFLMQDANVDVTEGTSFDVISSMTIAPVDILEGNEFTVLISQMPPPFAGMTTSVEYVNEALNLIQVYPNPFTGLIHVKVELEKTENLHFHVFNLNGMMMKTFREDNATGVVRKLIHLDALPAGQYAMIVQNDENKVLGRVKMVKVR